MMDIDDRGTRATSLHRIYGDYPSLESIRRRTVWASAIRQFTVGLFCYELEVKKKDNHLSKGTQWVMEKYIQVNFLLRPV